MGTLQKKKKKIHNWKRQQQIPSKKQTDAYKILNTSKYYATESNFNMWPESRKSYAICNH